jgi:NitT/TauT family transport system permease protein
MAAVTTAEAGAPEGVVVEKENRALITAKHLLLFAFLVALWEFAAQMEWLDPLLFPAPSNIAKSIWLIYVTQGNIWYHLYVTFAEALAGCFMGCVIGILLATSAALSVTFRNYLKPYIIVIEATPRIAVGPLFVAWLGFGFSSKVALAALVCFFSAFINTLTGLLYVDEEASELFQSLGANKWQVFWKLRVASASTIIMAGIKIAVGSAFGGALVAEFISANNGLGVLMYRYTYTLNMASAFAVLLSITFFAFWLFQLAEYVDYRMVFWRSDKLMQKKSRKRSRAFLKSIQS